MNTTAAATEAHVTVATIRTWCRIGAVAAIKQAGRWVIDTASLAARIAIGAMRTRKAPMNQPIEVDLGNGISIRAHQETSPADGRTTWYAHKMVNGYRVPGSADGRTAEEAIARLQRTIEEERAENARLATLEDAGLYADLTVNTPGIYAQLDGLTAAPRSLRAGECPTCGLNARSCDCR